jgi:hypothetical protein
MGRPGTTRKRVKAFVSFEDAGNSAALSLQENGQHSWWLFEKSADIPNPDNKTGIFSTDQVVHETSGKKIVTNGTREKGKLVP